MMNAIGLRIGTLTGFGSAATSSNASSSLQTATSTPQDTYASGFLHSLFAQIIQWFADAENGINELYANIIHAKEVHAKKFCAQKSDGTEVCVNGDQLAAVLASQQSK